MPGDPIEIPSDTVIVLKVTLLPPALSAASAAILARPSICMLQGVRLLHVEAMPTWGLRKSSSTKPTARSMARLGDCLMPSTTRLEYARGVRVLALLFIVLRSASTGMHGRRAHIALPRPPHDPAVP